MPEKVLVYSRFPKALMLRIGQRFELMDAAGKPPIEVFPADQLAGVRAMITAGGTPLAGNMMDMMPKLGGHRLLRHRLRWRRSQRREAPQHHHRPQPRSQRGLGRRYRGHLDAGGDAAPAGGR